jgi:uncharacterized protein (UPF0276 family)
LQVGPAAHAAAVPARAGIGLRAPHQHEVLAAPPAVGWLEVHSENYFADGGPALAHLERARERYPISLHGVGLSLGSTDPLNTAHLRKLKALAARIEPALVSEHLSWSSVDRRFLNDLLPLPYTEEALEHICTRIAQVQDFLGRRMLVENISSYLQFSHSTIPEWDFVAEISRRAGCGILLDVNNIYVSASNHRFDPLQYLRAIPAQAVGEIHLAGHESKGGTLIDTHSRPVCDAVWVLYREALDRFGAVPALIEWDNDIPELRVLVGEAHKADAILGEARALAA